MDLAQILSPENSSNILYMSKESATNRVIYQNHNHTWLTINDVVQSAVENTPPYRPILPHTFVMLLPLLHDECPNSILELGAGGLSINRYLHFAYPSIDITSVDIDQLTLDAVQQHFAGSDELKVVKADAYEFIKNCPNRYDWVMVDLFYGADSPILSDSEQFFSQIKALMNDGGWMVLNLLTKDEQTIQHIDKAINFHLPGKQYRFAVPHMQNQIRLVKINQPEFSFPAEVEQHNLIHIT